MLSRNKVYSIVAVLLVAALSLSLLPSLSTPVVGAKTSAELKAELDALQQQKAENDAKLQQLQQPGRMQNQQLPSDRQQEQTQGYQG